MKAKEALKRIELAFKSLISSSILDTEEFKVICQALTELEELKKRDTAMKVLINLYKKVVGTIDEFYIGKMYCCPKCNTVIVADRGVDLTIFDKHNYCDTCGQRLDWSDKDE